MRNRPRQRPPTQPGASVRRLCRTLLGGLLLVSAAHANLDYRVDNGVFVTSEGTIPNGCFAQLVTELNGDNVVAAVYLNRTGLRGCIAANIPYAERGKVTYTIVESLGEERYNLQVCIDLDGSLGRSCDRITIRFKNQPYVTPNETKAVLTVEKLGEW